MTQRDEMRREVGGGVQDREHISIKSRVCKLHTQYVKIGKFLIKLQMTYLSEKLLHSSNLGPHSSIEALV